MKRSLLLVTVLFQVTPTFSQQRPMVTEPVETVQPGYVLFGSGMEFLQDVVFPFSGLEGDLTRVGVTDIRIGAGEIVELQLQGTVRNFLNVKRRFPAPNTHRLDFLGDSSSDFGDITVGTKVRLKKEKGSWPALGMRFAMEVPVARNETGLGNDESNLFSSFLLEKNTGKLKILSNFGLAILGDPVTPGAQDDLLTYGFALLYPVYPRVTLLGDLYGRVGPGGIGTEEQSLLRVGAQIQGGGLYWDLALLLGFRDTDPVSGIVVGVSKQFKFPLLEF